MITKFYKRTKELWAAEIQIISIVFGTNITLFRNNSILSAKIKQLEDQISLIYFDITLQEKLAVTKVIENPKFFFSYGKRFSKQKSNVGPLYNNDSLTNNPSGMANILQKQYDQSVFSDPNRHDKILPDADITCSNPNITDI